MSGIRSDRPQLPRLLSTFGGGRYGRRNRARPSQQDRRYQ